MCRYWRIARANKQLPAFIAGFCEGLWRLTKRVNRRPLSQETFETFARIEEAAIRLTRWRDKLGIRSVVLVDLGKNVYAYWHAARECGLKILAIADDRLGPGRYRGIPILPTNAARTLNYDAVLISNLSPVHAQKRAKEWRALQSRPVI